MADPAPDPLVGTLLGPCRLDKLVGVGGMGRVYKGRHLPLDRDVAVKLVDRAAFDAAPRSAALAEARAAAKLEDPRIVAVYEVGEDHNVGFIVMQWVDGETLQSKVWRDGPLSPEASLAMARDMAAALAVAHKAGIVHRDVKPGNVLLDARGGIKLTDFGIAGTSGRVTDGGEAVGSVYFMSPEQGWGAAPEPRMDLYALGATWYFALTGDAPFEGSPGDVLIAHRETPAPDVRVKRPELTRRMAALIARLLEKEPEKRPASAEELLRELASRDLLLEVDASGSAFRLLPPREPARAPAAAAAVEPRRERPAPAPLPAPEAPRLGSRATFNLFLGVLALAAAGWPWRLAGPEDWLAGCVVCACAPLVLAYGDRRTGFRRALGAGAGALSLACVFAYLRPGLGTVPSLETLIAGGFGVVAVVGAVYLAHWGVDREEAVWARALGPLGAVLLAAAALTWTAADSDAWFGALAAAGARSLSILAATGGGWRWGGVVALAAALAATRRLRTVAAEKPTDRRLNWTA